MTQSDRTDAVDPTIARGRTPAPRDISFAGTLVVLFFCLAAGVVCSAIFHGICGAIDSGWHWKGPTQKLDTSPGDSSDQAVLTTFKKVDIVELEDSLHLLAATEAMMKMDYGKSLAEVQQVSAEYREEDSGCTTLEVEDLLSLKQSDKVVSIATATIAKKPHDYAGWLWRAQAYEQLKQYDKAVSDYKKSLEMFAYTKKALAVQLTQVYAEKIEQAIEGLVYRRMGASYERLGDFKNATINYEKSIRCNTPNLPSTLEPKDRNNQAASKSVAELTTAIASNPDDNGLYLLRGTAYKLLGKYNEALADYNHYKPSADATTIYYERGGVYYKLGRFKEAARDLRKVHLEDPLYELPHMRQKKYALAVLPMTSMKKNKVLRRFDKMIQESPNDLENYLSRGVLQMAFHSYDEGAADIQQYLSDKADKCSVTVTKANIFLALCRGLSKRKNEYDFILAKDAENSSQFKWWQSIILYLEDKGVTEKALLDSVGDNKARAVQAHYYIGQRLAMKGLKEKADEHWKEGIALGAQVDEYYLCKLALLPQSKDGASMDK